MSDSSLKTKRRHLPASGEFIREIVENPQMKKNENEQLCVEHHDRWIALRNGVHKDSGGFVFTRESVADEIANLLYYCYLFSINPLSILRKAFPLLGWGHWSLDGAAQYATEVATTADYLWLIHFGDKGWVFASYQNKTLRDPQHLVFVDNPGSVNERNRRIVEALIVQRKSAHERRNFVKVS